MPASKIQPIQIQASGITAGTPIIAGGTGSEFGKWGLAGSALFGNQYQYVASLGETSTTDAVNWTTKLQLTTPSTLPAGTYRACASFQCKSSADTREFEYRWVLDGTTTTQHDDIGYKEYQQIGSIAQIVLTAGVHTVELDFRVGDSGTSYMREVRMDFWRLS